MILFLRIQINAQNQSEVDYPEVPRVSAYEAYVKYKERKSDYSSVWRRRLWKEAYRGRHLRYRQRVLLRENQSCEFPKEWNRNIYILLLKVRIGRCRSGIRNDRKRFYKC